MIEQSKLSENSVERLFCIPFENQTNHTPLTIEETKIFIQLVFTEKNRKGKGEDIEKLNSEAFPSDRYQILVKSIENGRFHFKISQEAAIFIAIMTRVIGDVIMYMAYLQYRYAKEKKTITMQTLADTFPSGFPSKDSMEKMWDSQKVERDKFENSDNLLDYKECYKSIMV
jgi:hypothetical protein